MGRFLYNCAFVNRCVDIYSGQMLRRQIHLSCDSYATRFFFFFHLKTGVSHTIRQIPGLSAQGQTTGTQTSSDNCGLDNKQPCVYLFYFRAAVSVCHMELHSSTNEMCVCVRFISVFTNEKPELQKPSGILENSKNQDGER